jgi:hypothetical protein
MCRSMKRYFLMLSLQFLLSSPSLATNISTADPNYPATFDDIDSAPLRHEFDALINDIDNLWMAVGSGGLSPAPAHAVLAGPLSGSPAIPSLRALTGNDLPLPSNFTIGGVESIAPVSHQFLTGISTLGVPSQAQPSFTDILGVISATQYLAATATGIGAVRADNSTILNTNGVLSAPGSSASAITALTGDVSATGPGSSVSLLATTSVTPGSYTNPRPCGRIVPSMT